MRLGPLPRERLEEARLLLGRACAFDDAAAVAEEKLFGPSPLPARATGAFVDDELAGVAVVSGRWLRLLAVDPARRRRGLGSSLLADAEAGAARLRVGDQPGNYLAPGIDERDAETRAFLAARGYHPVAHNENLDVPLIDNPLVTADRAAALARAAAAAGYEVRRARPDDAAALARLAGSFAAVWAFEAGLALAGATPTVHLALTAGEPVAFACIDANNRGLGWFGPAGTLAAHRGRGLGEALLIACLLDARAAGHDEAAIAWIGPRAFYQRACGARAGRRFVVLEKELAP